MKTMTRERWWELRAKTNCGMQCQPHEMREALDCITPIEDQTPNPDSALLRALGYEARDKLNAKPHHYCPKCGPVCAALDQPSGLVCVNCCSTVRDVNPGKEKS